MAKDGGIVLCTNKEPCDRINEEVVKLLFPSSLECIHQTTTANQAAHLLRWLTQPGFHKLTQAAVGARVMLTRNSADVSGGVVNGALGVISELVKGPPKPYHAQMGLPAQIVKIIKVQLDCGKEVPVRRTISANMQEGNRSYVKSTFPLVLGYAMTGHKAQGATLGGVVVIHATKAFCPGLMYVMLSRVTSSKQLFFTERLTPDMFTPMVIADMAV
jgi:ATP-dependent exoDNAse (exonuclease V) alpha subunit